MFKEATKSSKVLEAIRDYSVREQKKKKVHVMVF